MNHFLDCDGIRRRRFEDTMYETLRSVLQSQIGGSVKSDRQSPTSVRSPTQLRSGRNSINEQYYNTSSDQKPNDRSKSVLITQLT